MQMVEVWTYVSVLVIILLVIILFYLRKQVGELKEVLGRKQTQAYRIGVQQVVGDMSQLLGTFSVLSEYEEIILLSTTSRQGSVDVLGIKDDSLDFLEFKKEGAALTGSERKIRKLVEDGKVKYKILDVSLPEGFSVNERSR